MALPPGTPGPQLAQLPSPQGAAQAARTGGRRPCLQGGSCLGSAGPVALTERRKENGHGGTWAASSPHGWGDSCPQGPMVLGHPSPDVEVNCPLCGSDPKRCCWRSSPAEGSGCERGGVSGGGTSLPVPKVGARVCFTSPGVGWGPTLGCWAQLQLVRLAPHKRSGQDLAQDPFYPLR